jgi:hypothetical protein
VERADTFKQIFVDYVAAQAILCVVAMRISTDHTRLPSRGTGITLLMKEHWF